MSDTSTAAAPAANTSTRKSVSKRDLLDADGNITESWEEATGAQYELKGEGGKVFALQFGEPKLDSTMFAIFGFWTKVGNVANSILNDKTDPGTPAQAAQEIDEFLASIGRGVWRESTAKGAGGRVDKTILASVFYEYVQSKGAGDPAKDVAYYEQQFTDKPSLIAQVRRIPAVQNEYVRRTGQAPNEEKLLAL